jgi:hypothetical protein
LLLTLSGWENHSLVTSQIVGICLTIIGVTMVNITPSSLSKHEKIVPSRVEVNHAIIDNETSLIIDTDTASAEYGSFEVNYTKL